VLFAVRVPSWRAEVLKLLAGQQPAAESLAFPVRGADIEDPQPATAPQDAARLAPAPESSV
jgi:hypothetical protein